MHALSHSFCVNTTLLALLLFRGNDGGAIGEPNNKAKQSKKKDAPQHTRTVHTHTQRRSHGASKQAKTPHTKKNNTQSGPITKPIIVGIKKKKKEKLSS